MREIKFRGYFKKEKKWIYGIPSDFGETIVVMRVLENNGCVTVPIESFGQYTGHKDKKGKEIYEGDIIKDTGEDNFYKVIAWDEFRARFIGRIVNSGDTPMQWAEQHWIVVGNIYENSEILIQEKE